MEMGVVLKDKKYCCRGLEALTTVASLHRSKQREIEYDIVLDEQARQREAGIIDMEIIADLAQHATAACQMWANVIGMRDEMAAD